MDISEQVNDFSLAGVSICAVGVNGDSFDRFKALFEAGCKRFCIDTANAANTRVGKVIDELGKYKDVELVVGNVASKECYKWLTQWPCVKGIRVGIAGGAACTTRNATGVYHGMVSCIRECAELKSNNCLLIADGGIKEPQDFCKAIACGADAIMMGSLIAATADSPAEVININGVKYKRYHGSASFEIQKEYRDKPRYIEGRTKMLDYDGQTLDELMTKFIDGLRSSMSYFNARNFAEYRKNVTFS
jgi:IMP dehydrogenase